MARILLVDDEPIVTRTLRMLIEKELPGVGVCCANSAAEALELLHLNRYDMVITDVSMPRISGLELLEKIRSLDPACYVIVLTAYSSFEYAYKAAQYENVRFILKLEPPELIIAAVRNGLEQARQQAVIRDAAFRSDVLDGGGPQSSETDDVPDRVNRYILEHFSGQISLAQIAEKFSYNSSYLSRIYKQKTGEGLNEHIIRVRIEAACRLLRESSLSISEIAEKCGFQTTKYFITVFKRSRGMTPKAWRERRSMR